MGLCWKKMRNLVKLKRYWKSLPAASGCLPLYQLQVGAVWPEIWWTYGLILDIVHCWHVSGLAASFVESAQIMGNLTNNDNENMEKYGGFDQEVHTSRTWPGTYRTGFSSWNEQQDNLLETQIFPRPSLAVCHLCSSWLVSTCVHVPGRCWHRCTCPEGCLWCVCPLCKAAWLQIGSKEM